MTQSGTIPVIGAASWNADVNAYLLPFVGNPEHADARSSCVKWVPNFFVSLSSSPPTAAMRQSAAECSPRCALGLGQLHWQMPPPFPSVFKPPPCTPPPFDKRCGSDLEWSGCSNWT
jgi:hypothetical protein